jgi:hypothetical protein
VTVDRHFVGLCDRCTIVRRGARLHRIIIRDSHVC